jgi:16S rRNA (guanine527-N7)-methyltransferase
MSNDLLNKGTDSAVFSLRAQLLTGSQALNLSLNEVQIDKILAYMALLEKWGGVYNLTAIKDPKEILVHHVLDCLSVVLHVSAHTQPGDLVLDVGSGAGLPAIMIAIACPHLKITALDAVAKKVAFINQAALQLGLLNITGKHARIEKETDPIFKLVVSRAFASLKDFVIGTRKALSPGGLWMAMKGKEPLEELAELPEGIEIVEVVPLTVPGLDAQRCLVWLKDLR